MAENVVSLLSSSLKIERDRGVAELQRYLSGADDLSIRGLELEIQRQLDDPSATWEAKHGALMGMKAILQGKSCSDEFVAICRQHTLRLLEDGESRVRLASGELMGVLCQRQGAQVYAVSRDLILDGIRSNLERQALSDSDIAEQQEAEKLRSKLAGREQTSSDAEQIFHDTAGWKSLETWMKCLQFSIEGSGTGFNEYIDQDLLNLVFTALTHTNRFVRETGYYVCASLVSCNYVEGEEMTDLTDENAIYFHGQQFAEQLSCGLADNWSQSLTKPAVIGMADHCRLPKENLEELKVRLAASVATRKFLLSLPVDEVRHKFYPLLLPPLCLNRYYVAEGVRIYNQDTWRQVTGGDGRQLVEIYIKQVVEFYISQTEADNHAVREAACACIAELGSKIDKNAVRPYVASLLDALLVCFKDESWPVRDAACVACGNFVLCFPEESKPVMDELFPLFYENLQDNIPSVRQGAAIALANVVKAYGQEAAENVLAKVQEGLAGIEKQPANAEKYSGLDKGPATYGVVKQARDNDMDLHTNKQMYSCGSLAPKMHRGKRGGGCMDHQFRRASEPWELGDGCVYLLAELSQMPELSAPITKLLPLLATSSTRQHYTQHIHFLDTLCKQLPVIAKGIGKRPFKMHLEMFLDAIFYSLTCDNALTSSAASQCLNQMSSFIGPSILRGRVEAYNSRYVAHLDANQFIAPL